MRRRRNEPNHEKLDQVPREALGPRFGAVDAQRPEELLREPDLADDLGGFPGDEVLLVERRPVDRREGMGGVGDSEPRNGVDGEPLELSPQVRVLGVAGLGLRQDRVAERESLLAQLLSGKVGREEEE